MAEKEVKIKVVTDVEDAKVQALEQTIENIENKTATLEVNVEDGELNSAREKEENLDDTAEVNVDVEDGELDATKSKVDDLDGTTIDIDVNNISAMEAVDQIGAGFDRLKSGASEVGQQLGSVLESAGRMENTETFLKMNLGADQAVSKLNEIRSVTDSLPGDDVVLQNLLSQAAIQDLSLAKDDFQLMGSAAADYMAAMENFGKTSKETQQDLMNYILAGNTAELEGSPILQDKIDKLKEGTTVQERAKLLAESINEAHWGGISSQDTYNNKMQQFNDMLERGKMNAGGLFLEAAKGGMDFALQLDEATHGLVGMTVALAGFASPIADTLIGIGQIGQGFRALKDAGDLIGLRSKFESLKTTLLNVRTSLTEFALSARTAASSAITSLRSGLTTVATAARTAATSLLSAGRAALTSAANAVKSAALWVAEKAAKVASTIASYALAAAQAVLNTVMNMNPIMIVVLALIALAAALIWAYNNVDWFREMVDNAWKKLQEFAAFIWGGLTGALDWLGQAFNNAGQSMQDAINGAVDWIMSALQGLWDYITSVGGLLPEGVSITGNQIIDSVLGVLMFLNTLPLQIAMIFVNIIAKALGFGDNFSQNMIQGAVRAVTGFIGQISQLPGRAWSYLSQLISRALSFASTFVNNLRTGAVNAVNGFINQIKTLPGKLKAEFDAMLAMAQDFVMQIANILTGGGAGMVIGWLTGSGEHSPGFMYDALQGELTAMVGLPMEILSGLIMSISDIGMQMATALSEALFGINFDSVTNSIGWLQSTLMGLWEYIVQLVALVPVTIQSVAMQVMASLQQVIAYIATLPGQIAAYLNTVVSNAASFASRFVSNVSKAGSDAASQFVSSIKSLASSLASELQNMLSVVDQWAATLPQKFWDAGVNAVKNFLSALGINSPGIMQRTMIWEVSEMAKRVPIEGKYLVENVAGLGEDIVDAFGEPGLSVSFDDTINGRINKMADGSTPGHVVNLSLEIGSVDNEDRIQEIVEAVRRELAWNNLLAGRTVNDDV